jgi:fermentation-respiration switch protein FrsA (DUF1100 family)
VTITAAQISKTEVEYYSDGTRIAADLFVPGGLTGPAPAVIVAHGFGGIKSFFVEDIARAIAEAGYVTITFDYRGFGESDGRRNRLHPLEQVEDILATATYLRTLDEVDSERLAAYGTSFGGGIAIAATASDEKMKAAVCAVGIGDCNKWLRSLRRNWEWIEFVHMLEEDQRTRVLTGVSQVVEPEVIMVRDPESEKHEAYLRENWPDRAFKLDLASGDAIRAFKAVDYARQLGDKALLLIGVDEDGLTSYEHTTDLYEAASGPKTLVALSGMTHHDIYKPLQRQGLMAQVVEFLNAHLAKC